MNEMDGDSNRDWGKENERWREKKMNQNQRSEFIVCFLSFSMRMTFPMYDCAPYFILSFSISLVHTRIHVCLFIDGLNWKHNNTDNKTPPTTNEQQDEKKGKQKKCEFFLHLINIIIVMCRLVMMCAFAMLNLLLQRKEEDAACICAMERTIILTQ